jgi:uncharacterized protein (UPF0147 family)
VNKEEVQREMNSLRRQILDERKLRTAAEQAQSHLVSEVNDWKLRADRLLNVIQNFSHSFTPKLPGSH